MLNNSLAVLTLCKPLNNTASPFLHSPGDRRKEVDTFQKSLYHILPDFFHHRRRRVNTEQVFEPFHKRVNDMLFNPCAGVIKELLHTLSEAVPEVSTSLLELSPFFLPNQCVKERVNHVIHDPRAYVGKSFADCVQKVYSGFLPILPGNLFIPPVLNVLPNTSKEAAKELNTRTNGCAKESKDTACDTSPVNVGKQVFDFLPEQRTQVRPVVAVQPLCSFIKRTNDKITDTFTYQPPIQFTQETDNQVRDNGKPLYHQPPCVGKIYLTQSRIKQFCYVRSKVGKIGCIKEPIRRLNCTVQSVANLMTNTRPINAVHNLVKLFTQKGSKFFPVPSFKRRFQFVGKLRDRVFNRQLLKHGTIVFAACATAARTRIIILTDNVQFINSSGSVLNLFCSLFRCPCGITDCVPVRSGRFLRRSIGTCARQSRKKLIDDIQQSNKLINQEVDSRSQSVNDRRYHSPHTVFQVLETRSQTVHTTLELTAHE